MFMLYNCFVFSLGCLRSLVFPLEMNVLFERDTPLEVAGLIHCMEIVFPFSLQTFSINFCSQTQGTSLNVNNRFIFYFLRALYSGFLATLSLPEMSSEFVRLLEAFLTASPDSHLDELKRSVHQTNQAFLYSNV